MKTFSIEGPINDISAFRSLLNAEISAGLIRFDTDTLPESLEIDGFENCQSTLDEFKTYLDSLGYSYSFIPKYIDELDRM